MYQIFIDVFFILQIEIQIIEDLQGSEADQKNKGVTEVVVEGVDYFLQRACKATHLDQMCQILPVFVTSPQPFISLADHFQKSVNI
jgi:hypothetical protein